MVRQEAQYSSYGPEDLFVCTKPRYTRQVRVLSDIIRRVKFESLLTLARHPAKQKKRHILCAGERQQTLAPNPSPPPPPPCPLLLSATAFVSTVSLAALCSIGIARALRLPPRPPGGVGLT